MSITEAILCIVTMYSNIMFRLAMITSFGRASRQRGAERALVLLRFYVRIVGKGDMAALFNARAYQIWNVAANCQHDQTELLGGAHVSDE